MSGDFHSPTDAVVSPDGSEFYFAAYDADSNPAIYQSSSAIGSTAEKIASSDPLDLPMGLVMSCDGSTLYIADAGTGDGNDGTPDGQEGAIFSLPAGGGTLTALLSDGIVHPHGLAMGPDCDTLYVTGWTTDGIPALFTLKPGGAPQLVHSGAPLTAPTGLHVDKDGVAWVMDHLAVGSAGEGVLFAIPSDGSAVTEVASNLHMGTPGGVSLVAGGGTAVMPTLDASGKGQLTAVDIATGETTQIPATDMLEPAGLRTAREAGVFAVVDAEGGAIYRAE